MSSATPRIRLLSVPIYIHTSRCYLHGSMSRPTNLDTKSVRELQAIYKRHFAALSEIAIDQFHLPHTEAAALAHDVLLAAIHNAPRIPDLTAWLRGAITCAATARLGERE